MHAESEEWAIACAAISAASLVANDDIAIEGGEAASVSLANELIDVDLQQGRASARYYAVATMTDGRVISGRLTNSFSLADREWQLHERVFMVDFEIPVGRPI